MKATTCLAVLALLCLGLTACPLWEVPPETATFVLINLRTQSTSYPQQYAIHTIRFQGPNDIGYGANMLEEGEWVYAGESVTFYLPTPGGVKGNWRVRIDYLCYCGSQSSSEDPDCGGARDEETIVGVQAGQLYTWNWGIQK